MTKREILTQLIAAEIAYGGREHYHDRHDTVFFESLSNKIIEVTPDDEDEPYQYDDGNPY